LIDGTFNYFFGSKAKNVFYLSKLLDKTFS
jgi:hypothetical protein